MKAMKALFNSLIPSRKETRQGNPIIPSLPKAPPKTPPKTSSSTAPTARTSSPKSNRATRGSNTGRSVYSSRTPELTNNSPLPRKSASLQRLVDVPAKTATPRRTGKLPPLKHKNNNNPNILKVLTEDALSQVFKQVALQHPQQIVLNNDFLNFYKETTLNLNVSKNFNREDLDTRLLSKLHTIYLNNSPITSEIVKILEKTLKYNNITTIILCNVEFESDAIAASFFTFLRNNAPKLENLIIRASPKISNENIVKLISAISGLNKLVLLELSGFDFTGVYTGTFTFDDMFINLLIFLPDLEYLVFNNNIIDEHHYRRIFISTYAISAPKSETSIKDRYNMYIKSEYMKFYDKGNTLSAQTPSYFFDLIKFKYADGKADVQIYRDIFFYTIRNQARTNAEGTLKYLATFDTNPVLNVYRSELLSKYPKELAIPIMKRDTGKRVASPT